MRKKTWTFLFYLSETREVADLLLLPTETGAEPRWSRMTTCHLNTEAVTKLKKQKTSSHLILHMPTLATALFYTVVCRGGSIKKRDIRALFVAFVISIQRLIFFFLMKAHRAKQYTSINSTVYIQMMIIVHLLTEALTVCFFFSFLGSMWATTTSGHCDASSLRERKHSSVRHMTECLSSRTSTHTQFNTTGRVYKSRYLFKEQCTVIKQYL